MYQQWKKGKEMENREKERVKREREKTIENKIPTKCE